jgi:hypothetical protein
VITDVQRKNALRLANEKRGAVRKIKLHLEAGTYSLADVLVPAPMAAVEQYAVVDIVRWVPRFGDSRLRKFGAMAAEEGVNLLLAAGQMSRQGREWVVATVLDETTPKTSAERSQQQRAAVVVGSEDLLGRLMRAERRVERLTQERNAAQAMVRELDVAVAGRQFTLPTVEAERMLAELADAVEVHKRTVTDPTSPPDKWAFADETLWNEKDRVLESGVHHLRAVA